mgnify:CR=1 FL=1
MTRTKRGLWRAVLLGLIAAGCWLAALIIAGDLAEQYGGLSVRFAKAAVTQKDLERAQSESTSEELVLRAAWTRKKELQTLGSELGGSAKARVIGIYSAPFAALRWVFTGKRRGGMRSRRGFRLGVVSFLGCRRRNTQTERQGIRRSRHSKKL